MAIASVEKEELRGGGAERGRVLAACMAVL